jgi:hypothetical protein
LIALETMPYEAEIPPVPTRDQELKMIEKISADFLAQGTFEPNIAEADRIAKLELNLTLWEYRWNYRINWILGNLIFPKIGLMRLRALARASEFFDYFFRNEKFINS